MGRISGRRSYLGTRIRDVKAISTIVLSAMIGKFLRNQKQGFLAGRGDVSLGENHVRRFLAPASKFRFVVK
ncbi:hypothetical protein A2U01_0003730, partial [Trifolium medium]|nr:hypothetical protein [Trifolium medium]